MNQVFDYGTSQQPLLRWLVERLRQDGWKVELIYLALPSIEMSKLRVAERVAHGGHNIPLADIERRFPRSLGHLLNDFSQRVDACSCLMNAGECTELLFEQHGFDRAIFNDDQYQLLREQAKQ